MAHKKSLITRYQNTRDAARDIHAAVAAKKGKQFTMRPWNHFSPDDTLWWLVPSTQWPACDATWLNTPAMHRSWIDAFPPT